MEQERRMARVGERPPGGEPPARKKLRMDWTLMNANGVSNAQSVNSGQWFADMASFSAHATPAVQLPSVPMAKPVARRGDKLDDLSRFQANGGMLSSPESSVMQGMSVSEESLGMLGNLEEDDAIKAQMNMNMNMNMPLAHNFNGLNGFNLQNLQGLQGWDAWTASAHNRSVM